MPIIEMVTVMAGGSVPLGGMNLTLGLSLEADQCRLPCEPGVFVSVAIQVQALELELYEQLELLEGLKLDGLTVKVGFEQLHGTETLLAGPVKVRVALAGHIVFGTFISTCIDLPDDKLWLGAWKAIPSIPLPDDDQFK
jgi:hypothetical protein